MSPANIRSLFLSLLVVLLTACMGGSPAPQDHYYRLALETPSNKENINLPYTTIGIPPSLTNGLYRERPILYVDTQAPLELQQYHYHHWHDAPARIIQEHLINWLQHKIPDSHILRLSQGEQSDIMLQTRVVRFERIHSRNGIGVLVEIEVVLQKNYRTLHQKIYQQTVNVQHDTMHDTALAFGKALENIYTTLISDIIQ